MRPGEGEAYHVGREQHLVLGQDLSVLDQVGDQDAMAVEAALARDNVLIRGDERLDPPQRPISFHLGRCFQQGVVEDGQKVESTGASPIRPPTARSGGWGWVRAASTRARPPA